MSKTQLQQLQAEIESQTEQLDKMKYKFRKLQIKGKRYLYCFNCSIQVTIDCAKKKIDFWNEGYPLCDSCVDTDCDQNKSGQYIDDDGRVLDHNEIEYYLNGNKDLDDYVYKI